MTSLRFALDHRFTRSRLSDWIDGELSPRQRARVQRHLDECEDCTRMERALRRLVAGLRGLGVRVPERLADEAVRRVRASAGPGSGEGES